MFEFIELKVCPLRPSRIMADYEVALREAVRVVYPQCLMSACIFHFKQAARRKARKLTGFFKWILADQQRELIFLKTLNLPHLPAEVIQSEFNDFKFEGLQLGDEFAPYLNYFEKYWILKEGPKRISVFGLDQRTNNMVESHNASLSKAIKVNSGLFTVISKLKEDEARRSHDFNCVLQGKEGVFRKPCKKYSESSARINAAQNELKDGKISPAELLCRLTQRANKWVDNNLAHFPEGVSDDEESDNELDVISLMESDPDILTRIQNRYK